MKRNHFLIILAFCITAVAVAFRPFYATTWAGTASNQMVTRAALLDAVNNGVFTANTTIPNDLRVVTREMAQAYVNIQPITSYAMNRLVPKSAFVSAVYYYPFTAYGKCLSSLSGPARLEGFNSSASALADYSTGTFVNLYALVNRNLQIGDEVFASSPTAGVFPAVVNWGDLCTNTGYWIYVSSLNAAVQVTNTNSSRQYVIDIVYPSGTTNVSICLIVDVSGTQATVQASANNSVSTAVTVDWNYTINGTESIGTPVTINSGNNLSNVHTINHGSTINTISVSINSFSPSSHGSQNYISGGTCN